MKLGIGREISQVSSYQGVVIVHNNDEFEKREIKRELRHEFT